MNFKIDLFMDIIWLGTLCGLVSTVAIQLLKESGLFYYKKTITIASMVIKLFLGITISLIFTDLNFSYCLATGFTTLIGGQAIYNSLKSKNIMKSSSELFEYVEEAVDNSVDINKKKTK